ncbi:hypothetical protein WDZ17_06855 [Pseudokineococcus basanitobsidens]|uniref:Uncharacterized protein n=1 Tax=Pseudokineococcus basanitobsidens TaxID=1926649 RepID=A0ABU8RIY3_9ACTN
MSSSEVHQSAASLLVRRLAALLGVLALVGGVVWIVVQPTNYSGWVAATVGLVVAVLVFRRHQQTADGQILRRSHLRARG